MFKSKKMMAYSSIVIVLLIAVICYLNFSGGSSKNGENEVYNVVSGKFEIVEEVQLGNNNNNVDNINVINNEKSDIKNIKKEEDEDIKKININDELKDSSHDVDNGGVIDFSEKDGIVEKIEAENNDEKIIVTANEENKILGGNEVVEAGEVSLKKKEIKISTGTVNDLKNKSKITKKDYLTKYKKLNGKEKKVLFDNFLKQAGIEEGKIKFKDHTKSINKIITYLTKNKEYKALENILENDSNNILNGSFFNSLKNDRKLFNNVLLNLI